MLLTCNTVTVNEDLAFLLSSLQIQKFGNCALQLKRFQIFNREFWDNIAEHTHPYFELLIILKGSLRYSIENHYVQLEGGGQKLLLIPPGIPHDRSTISKEDIVVIIQFSMTPLDSAGAALQEDLQSELAKCHYELEPVVLPDFKSIIELCEKHPPLWKERLCNRFENFLLEFFVSQFGALFVENPAQKKSSAPRGMRIKRLEQIIEITLDTHLRLEDYATRIGISSRQIERLIRQYHSMSFSHYLRMRRLETAKKMLASPFTSIKDIADALGYDDFSYFCRIFRNYTGLTPGEYAKRCNPTRFGKW